MQSFHDLLVHRRSIRKYTNQPLDPEQVKSILEAALMAPAGKRRNPWQFVIVENREKLQALAVAKEHGATPIAEAAIAIAVIADPEDSDTWIEDLSIASILIQLQCSDLGLGSCWIQMKERYDAEGTPAEYNIRNLLEIPEQYRILAIIAIGHPAEERKPYDPDKLSWEKVHIEHF